MKKKWSFVVSLTLSIVMSLGMAVPVMAKDVYDDIKQSVSFSSSVEEKYGMDLYVKTSPIQMYHTYDKWDNDRAAYYPVTEEAKDSTSYNQQINDYNPRICKNYYALEKDSKIYVENTSKNIINFDGR